VNEAKIEVRKKRRRSALEAFDGCPFRYNAIYNLGAEDKGDEANRGIAFHEIAFRYIDRLAKARTPMDAEELALAISEGIALSNCPTALLDEVNELAGRWGSGFELDLDAYLTAEERLESDLFTWIPDLVYVRPTHVEILDWKTFYKGFTEAQARKEFQARFYLKQALAIWPGFPEYWFTFVFVRLNYRVTIKVKPEEIETWGPQVDGILAGLENAERTGTWPAVPGSHCGLCRLTCPVVDNPARLPVRLIDVGQRDTAAGEILPLEQRLKALKKSLAAYVTKEGPFVLNGQLFQQAQTESVTYPAVKALDFLKDHGVDPADVTLSKTALAKPAKALNAEHQADLSKLAVTKTGWRFGHKKAGAFDEDEAED
jgi:hypothetical protein